MEFDAIKAYELVYCEIQQQRETGHDVADAEQRLTQLDESDRAGLLALYDEVSAAERREPWPYDEPDDLAGILAEAPETPPLAVDASRLEDQILGGWLGRIAGCNLGKPVEDGDHWTSAHLREYLELAGAYPLRDYIPVLDPMPERFQLIYCWPTTTLGRVNGSERDDDIDYSILGLHLVEHYGSALTTADVARAWLEFLPFRQVYTAERVAYRNLVEAVPITRVAAVRNPYREWVGAQIRGDIFGWVNPGDPRTAATQAYIDAVLSHVGNGIYGEMWAAALIAAAFTSVDPAAAVRASLDVLPPRSRLAEAVRTVSEIHADGGAWQQAIDWIEQHFAGHSWVHTLPNAAIVTAGVLWGGGDYATTVGLTVQAGFDTDSNGATAGSAAGVLEGARGLPSRFTHPLHDTVRSALFGFDHSSISELAARTVKLAAR